MDIIFENIPSLTKEQFLKIKLILTKIEEEDSKLPNENIVYNYGNSGFKLHAESLSKLAFRMVVGTYLKSIEYDGLPLGIMITASDNKYSDNGFKIAGIKGEPIPNEWREFYNKLANNDNLVGFLSNYVIEYYKNNNKCINFSNQSAICFAIDNRPSSKSLFTIFKDTLMLLNSRFVYYEILTTPGLFFLTYINQLGHISHNELKVPGKFTFFQANEYWNFLNRINETLDKFYGKFDFLFETNKENRYENTVVIDCSHGVAGFCVEKIKNIFKSDSLNLIFINSMFKNYSLLNEFCGSDFMLKEKILPINYPTEKNENRPNLNYTKNISLDGDADRIVYFYIDPIDQNNPQVPTKIINGEHFKCLISKIFDLLINNLSKDLKKRFVDSICIAIFNSFYTNSAIKNYLIKNITIGDIIYEKPGIQNFLNKAKNFDISVCYETNGRGSVFSNEEALKKIDKLYSFCYSAKDCQILEFLTIFLNSFNKTMGDSLSTMIVIEKCMKLLNYSLIDVYNLFHEIPSDYFFIEVDNISQYENDEAEMILEKPENIQTAVDDYIASLEDPDAKCFFKALRSNNTIRVYVESNNPDNIKNIYKKAKSLIEIKIE